ncbi:thiamine pyrophosphate-dependent enzyme [Sphingobacterium sp. E70]|uniref:thiamine pyrophosphate-dependent enzyme n=1 Tax=Sphingobacterium sp. E70 TaxID=2853439 RepID=UPI00211BA8F2|nr:thiamine pyrophosphate-dependent enzyme [Sphingobacterium sp. E70]ULT29002.1 thiamine pyrophosphate-dependent enzyme [Sphingobacterium sp. E70]
MWDDGYGISVSNETQTTKGDISEILKGFQKEELTNGIEIFKVRGWDYAGLCETYEQAANIAREKHIPCLIHVTELTQPQGHSSSGSHERYKSQERLQWETDFDCIAKMKEWIQSSGIATDEELDQLDREAKDFVRQEQKELGLIISELWRLKQKKLLIYCHEFQMKKRTSQQKNCNRWLNPL